MHNIITKGEKLLIEFQSLQLDTTWLTWPVSQPIRFSETDIEFLVNLLKEHNKRTDLNVAGDVI
jgi:hypothetical protein